MMWVHTSSPLAGEVDCVDETSIVTRIGCLYGLPVAPEQSFVQHTPADADEPVLLPIPLEWRSIAAAMLPRWSVVLGVVIAVGSALQARDANSMVLAAL